MVTPSGGLLLFLMAPGVLLLSKRWRTMYSAAGLAVVFIYHWFLPREAVWMFDFSGFQVVAYLFRPQSQMIGLILALFGFIYQIFIWSRPRGRLYYFFSLLHIASALGILFVDDYLSFFILWEMLTVTALLLIIIEGNPGILIKKYFLYQLSGAVALMIGSGISFARTGSLAIEPVSAAYPFFLLAISIKAAVIPFHFWLLQTYPRVSGELAVLLSAYATKVGVFAILLLVPDLSLEIAGGLLAVVAVLYALKQHRLRNFLSLHIVSQIGYMITGVGSLNAGALLGGTYHIMSHVLYKGLLFMTAVVLTRELDSDDIIGPGGIGVTRRRPLLFVVALIASAAITGLPPFNGYISKTLLVEGVESPLAAGLLNLASVGTGISFTKFLYYCFLRPGGGNNVERGRRDRRQMPAMLILAGLCLVMGLFPGPFLYTEPFMAFFTPASLMKGMLPGLAAVVLFSLYFEEMNRAVVRLLPERVGFREAAEELLGYIMDHLQAVHAGYLRHYLFWLFGGLAVLWWFVLLR